MAQIRALAVAMALLLALSTGKAGGRQAGPFKVKVEDDKPVVVETVQAIDPQRRIEFRPQGNMNFSLTAEGRTMHLGSINTLFKIDDRITYVNPPGKVEVNNAPLPKKAGGKPRDGMYGVFVVDRIRITQTLEVAPTRSPEPKANEKRKLDAVVVKYTVENQDAKPRKVAVRVNMDVFWVDNDGALFAAPTTHPGKILDGIELKGKAVPDFLHVLQVANLKNPGQVANFTFNLGNKVEPPNRVVLTRLGAWIDAWNMQPVQAMGDSAMGMYWDPKELQPGQKREMAYAYGVGIATNPENEGKVNLQLGGSFEPGKLFSVTAYVEDPAPGQTLALELPAGMERVEGAQVQPVPASTAEGGSVILWKGRVNQLGTFPLRVRSSLGVTQTKLVTVSK